MKKVLTSMFVVILSLTIALSSFSALASTTSVTGETFDPSNITVPETPVTFDWGWGYSAMTDKTYTASSTGTTQQLNGAMHLVGFSDLLKSTDKIAIDIYPTFTNEKGANTCYFKYSFEDNDPRNFSGDYDHPMKSGEKYTVVIDSADILNNPLAAKQE